MLIITCIVIVIGYRLCRYVYMSVKLDVKTPELSSADDGCDVLPQGHVFWSDQASGDRKSVV